MFMTTAHNSWVYGFDSQMHLQNGFNIINKGFSKPVFVIEERNSMVILESGYKQKTRERILCIYR